MTLEERASLAYDLKASGKCNCTQAVLVAFQDEIGLDSETLMKLGSGFAAGMGCMESTCGALTGAVMVSGLHSSGTGSPRVSKEILGEFCKMCGATICSQIKGVGTGIPLCSCPDCCRNAVLSFGKCLK